MATASPWASKPLVLDVDDDGRNEAVIATETGLRIIDPSDDWRSVPIPGPRAVPLAARSTAGEPGTSVTWLESTRRSGRRSVRLRAGQRGSTAGSRSIHRSSSRCRASRHRTSTTRRSGWRTPRPGSSRSYAPVADVDADGCADIVIPLAWIGCGSAPPRPGPSWLDTRPLGLVGPTSDPRLLVAAGLDWFPYIGGPSVPSPAAAGAPGAWRTGSSGRFALAEVPLTAITSGSNARGGASRTSTGPCPRTGTSSSAGRPGRVCSCAPSPVTETIPSSHASLLTDPAAFLHADVLDGEFSGLIVPGSLGTDGGGSLSSTSSRYDLRSTVRDTRGHPRRQLDRHRRRARCHGDPLRPGPGIGVDRYRRAVSQPRRSAAEPAVAVRHDAPWPKRSRRLGLAAQRVARGGRLGWLVRAPDPARAVATGDRGHGHRPGGQRGDSAT